MLSGIQHKKRLMKGVDDGQYYRDQPISQRRRPSGADFQPQNPRPTDTALPNPWRNSDQPHTDTRPGGLGDSRAKPGKDTFRGKDQVHCPICGQPTLSGLNSLENLDEDVRCTQCGARFRAEELLAAPFMEEMANVLGQHNMSNPVSIPGIKVKSFDKESPDITVKEWTGLDVNKFFPHAQHYANSKEYRKLLREYFGELSAKKREMIIAILKNGMRMGEGMSKISMKLRDVFDGDIRRAEIVARTEVVRIANEANLERMDDKGTLYVEYIASHEDGRRCENCADHDGKIYKLVDAKGLLPLHPQCRCTLTERYEP
jgi:SPP1 gp7 family putative phage head morphogenesis protein